MLVAISVVLMSGFCGLDTKTLLEQTQRLIPMDDGKSNETGDEFVRFIYWAKFLLKSNVKRGDTIEKSANSGAIIIDNPDNILSTNRRINMQRRNYNTIGRKIE